MQVTIKQCVHDLGPMTAVVYGKWYACTGSGFKAEYFNKESKQFEHSVFKHDNGYTSSPGLIAHMIHKAYPQATITIEPTRVIV